MTGARVSEKPLALVIKAKSVDLGRTVTSLVMEQYLERLARLQAQPTTLRNVRRTAALLEQAGLDPVRAQDHEVEEWLTGLPLASRTKRLHLENLRAACRYAVRRGTLKQSPTEYVRLPFEPDVEPHILTSNELREIRSRCFSDSQRLMFHLFAFTGMRRNEVRYLTWEDIDPSAESIRVRFGKAGKLRHVPIHPALGEVLSSVTWGQPVHRVLCGPLAVRSLRPRTLLRLRRGRAGTGRCR